tara:strand:- start:360 stop:794 length:435 start_codon:yes stop_codon:yes gene_type:complete
MKKENKNLIIISCSFLVILVTIFLLSPNSSNDEIDEHDKSKFVGIWEYKRDKTLEISSDFDEYTMILKPDMNGYITYRWLNGPIMMNDFKITWDIFEGFFIINPKDGSSSTIFEYYFDDMNPSVLTLEKYDNLWDKMKFQRKNN